jgi:hypothetical protein
MEKSKDIRTLSRLLLSAAHGPVVGLTTPTNDLTLKQVFFVSSLNTLCLDLT